jgi:hypothetical protein
MYVFTARHVCFYGLISLPGDELPGRAIVHAKQRKKAAGIAI